MTNIYNKTAAAILIVTSTILYLILLLTFGLAGIGDLSPEDHSLILTYFIIATLLLIFIIFLGILLFKGKKWAKTTSLVVFCLIFILSLIGTIKQDLFYVTGLIISIPGIIFTVLSLNKKEESN